MLTEGAPCKWTYLLTLLTSILKGAGLHMREFVIIRVYFYSPVTFYHLAHLHCGIV